jgi:hypothetical protein
MDTGIGPPVTNKSHFDTGMMAYNKALRGEDPWENYKTALFYLHLSLADIPMGTETHGADTIIKEIEGRLKVLGEGRQSSGKIFLSKGIDAYAQSDYSTSILFLSRFLSGNSILPEDSFYARKILKDAIPRHLESVKV